MLSWIWDLEPTSKNVFFIQNPFKNQIFGVILDLTTRANLQKVIFELKIIFKINVSVGSCIWDPGPTSKKQCSN